MPRCMAGADMHTVSEMARHWRHPDVLALRQTVNATDPRDATAYKAALNAIRDRVAAIKAVPCAS